MFPKTEIGLQKWLECINCERLRSLGFQQLRKQFICRNHFEKRFVASTPNRARLLHDAYPTLFTECEIASGIPQAAAIPGVTESVNREHAYVKKRRHMDHTYCKAEVVEKRSRTQTDSEVIYHEMIKDICKKYNKPYSRALQAQLYGGTDREICIRVVRDLKLPITANEFEMQLTNMAHKALPSAPLLSGVERLLTHFYDHKVPMALATNSTMQAVRMHAAARPKLFGVFHHMVSATDPDVDRGKPYPDIYLIAAQRFPIQPRPGKCLVFEDSAVGVEAAKAAGMQVVMIPDSRRERTLTRRATLVIRSLLEFKPEWFGLPPFAEPESTAHRDQQDHR